MIRTPSSPLNKRSLLAATLIALLAAACAVGPDYRNPPTVDTGGGWTREDAAAAPEVDLSAWWRSLGDRELERLVEAALAQNLDLRQARSRIAEARALRDATAGGHAPTLAARGSVTRAQRSANGSLPIESIPGLERTQTIYDAGFDAAWELDLFGRTRRAVEGATARLEATRAEARGTRISVAAELARTYLTLRGAQRELAAREASVATLRQTLELVRRREEVGDLAVADVARAQAALDAAAAALPGIRARLRAAALGLGVLLAEPPEHELALADTAVPEIALAPIPVGERAAVLRRRPDVRAAERKLAASTADIGVATAELFPKLSITAAGGFQSLSSSSLFETASETWSIVPLISWRIFEGGRVRAEIRAAEARQRTAALAYEQAVLAALGDAERALSDYLLGLETVRRRRAAVESASRSLRHAQTRFDAGDIALTEVLLEERTLRDAEQAYARAHTDAAIGLVALYKALGGGWDAERARKLDATRGPRGRGTEGPDSEEATARAPAGRGPAGARSSPDTARSP